MTAKSGRLPTLFFATEVNYLLVAVTSVPASGIARNSTSTCTALCKQHNGHWKEPDALGAFSHRCGLFFEACMLMHADPSGDGRKTSFHSITVLGR